VRCSVDAGSGTGVDQAGLGKCHRGDGLRGRRDGLGGAMAAEDGGDGGSIRPDGLNGLWFWAGGAVRAGCLSCQSGQCCPKVCCCQQKEREMHWRW